MKWIPLRFIGWGVLTMAAQAQTVQSLHLVANHIVYEPVSGKIYASVPSSVGTRGNTIATIDPDLAAVTRYAFVGSEPNVLAASDDGQFLYVGLDGAHAVRRYNIATHHAGLQFSLANGDNVGDLKVLPGAAHSIALSVASFSVGVAIYDDGVKRPNSLFDSIYSLVFSNSASVLYANAGNTFYTLAVDSSGVSVSNGASNLWGDFGGSIFFDPNAATIYETSARAADATSSRLLGQFTRVQQAYPNGGFSAAAISGIVPDSANGRIFFLIYDQFNQGSSVTLAAFDLVTFMPIGSLVIPNALTQGDFNSRPGDLVPWGTDGLAFLTNNGKIWLINGRTFPGLTKFQLDAKKVVGGALVNGTVTISRPAPPAGVVVTLNASDFNLTTLPASVTIPAGQTSASFSIQTSSGTGDVTLTAAYGVQSINRALQIVPSAGASVYPANVRVMHLATNDLVFDRFNNFIYASLPSSEIGIGNGICAIDPVKAIRRASVFLGSEPSRLAISDDGAFIYAGLAGAAAVRRFDPPTQTAELQFSLGTDLSFGPEYARELVVLPGEPHAVAITLVQGFTGVAIFDDGIERSNIYKGFPSADSITAGASASRLYGYDNSDTSFSFSRFDLDSNGITLLDSTGDLISGFGREIIFQSGLVFANSGEVIDPEARTLLGTYTGQGHMAMVPDVPAGKVYFVDRDDSGNTMLTVYNANKFTPLAAFSLPAVQGTASSLLRWSPDNVVFRTDSGQVILVNAALPALSTLTITPTRVIGGNQATGTVKLSNVAPVGGIKVNLVSSNPAVASVPKTVSLPAGAQKVSFNITTSQVSSSTTVTITAKYKGATKPDIIIVTP